MADGGNLRWESDSYTEDQVEAVLIAIGVPAESETESNFMCFCPYHGGRDTPSFTVSKTSGVFFCFNPSCNKAGNFVRLIKDIKGYNEFQIKRLIVRCGMNSKITLQDRLNQMLEPTEEFPEYVHQVTDWKTGEVKVVENYFGIVRQDMWSYAEPQLYMRGRSFEKQTLKDFDIGYDLGEEMIVVPMHDPMGTNTIGAVRRSIEGKRFKNTPKLPTSKTLFNVHRAKRTGDVVIICESSFDVMRLYQAGYPNAVAMLMGHFSEHHERLLGKYFNTIVIMTDFDDKKKNVHPNCAKCRKEGSNLCRGHNPGEELGMKIADKMTTKRIMWAHSGGSTRFAPGIKDVSDMNDKTIRECVKNAVSHFEYALAS